MKYCVHGLGGFWYPLTFVPAQIIEIPFWSMEPCPLVVHQSLLISQLLPAIDFSLIALWAPPPSVSTLFVSTAEASTLPSFIIFECKTVLLLKEHLLIVGCGWNGFFPKGRQEMSPATFGAYSNRLTDGTLCQFYFYLNYAWCSFIHGTSTGPSCQLLISFSLYSIIMIFWWTGDHKC